MGFFSNLGFDLSDKGEQALFECLEILEPTYNALRDGTEINIAPKYVKLIFSVCNEIGLGQIFDGDFDTALDRVIKLKKERGWK